MKMGVFVFTLHVVTVSTIYDMDDVGFFRYIRTTLRR